ncbi:MAG: hypothetical protein Q9227_008476 [Pyrenula ochraceoflavens]
MFQNGTKSDLRSLSKGFMDREGQAVWGLNGLSKFHLDKITNEIDRASVKELLIQATISLLESMHKAAWPRHPELKTRGQKQSAGVLLDSAGETDHPEDAFWTISQKIMPIWKKHKNSSEPPRNDNSSEKKTTAKDNSQYFDLKEQLQIAKKNNRNVQSKRSATGSRAATQKAKAATSKNPDRPICKSDRRKAEIKLKRTVSQEFGETETEDLTDLDEEFRPIEEETEDSQEETEDSQDPSDIDSDVADNNGISETSTLVNTCGREPVTAASTGKRRSAGKQAAPSLPPLKKPRVRDTPTPSRPSSGQSLSTTLAELAGTSPPPEEVATILGDYAEKRPVKWGRVLEKLGL